MVGHGIHSAVFGFTFGAYVCSIVPVIKVRTMNFKHMSSSINFTIQKNTIRLANSNWF